jgi:hypothetical protein
MNVDKILRLKKSLEKSGKDQNALAIILQLLDDPENIDLQIDLLGTVHLANWLPNRKRALWDTFDISADNWIKANLSRIYGKHGDHHAVCALLNCPIMLILTGVKALSPVLATVWDVPGAKACGLGLVKRDAGFKDYFYTGWKTSPDGNTAVIIEYVKEIIPAQQPSSRTDSLLDGPCELIECLAAELPYGHHSCRRTKRSFGSDESHEGLPQEHTRKARILLGFE